LVSLLDSDSYRNTLSDAAIGAMRTQDDPFFIKPLQEALQRHETQWTTRGFTAGLDALAYLARNEQDKNFVREFLARNMNHKKKGIQLAALTALGTLEDPKGSPILATFASAARESDERKAAEKALMVIHLADNPSNNLKGLRDEILELKQESRDTKKELDALRKKLESKTQKPPGKTIRSPRDR
jgi:HEAT repeat protein